MKNKAIASITILFIGLITLPAQHAQAFCGFYVSGADQKMFNNATQVVMMREGTKTVLSMQNNYEGPPKDFAMVIPVPVVLKEQHVKVLKSGVFAKIDTLAAPRLVEYWEQDPCQPQINYVESTAVPTMKSRSAIGGSKNGVTIEAQFDVGEYNVVVLSAKESNGLESWLTQNKYNIPKGAAPALKPYVEQGLYFFVAKVNPKKVSFKDGQAQLSPLRFHYDSKDFSLPVRLGLLNAKGKQDLIVHILAKNQRYEVANFKNVTIPTNLIVKQEVKQSFAQFYVSLFDYTLEQNPGAVVTEYSWTATTCDPCPAGNFGGQNTGGPLNSSDLATFGADVLGAHAHNATGWVLTRLHARYSAAELKDDLVFKKADPIVGGRGTPVGVGVEAKLAEEGAQKSSFNNFQGRYIMLNPWKGEAKCAQPRPGIWGGPSHKDKGSMATPAQNTAFAKRGAMDLAKVVDQRSAPALGIKVAAPTASPLKNKLPQDTYETKKSNQPSNNCSMVSVAHKEPVHTSLLWFMGCAGLCFVRRRERT